MTGVIRGNQGTRRRIKGNRLFALITLAFILIISCEKSPYEEYEPQLNIYCFLRNDKPQQEVIVDRTYKIDEVAKFDLEDVCVILSGNGQCDTLVQRDDSIGIFSTRGSFLMIPDTSYDIKVSAKDFASLTGTTTMPDSFKIISPLLGDTVDYYSDTLCIAKNRIDDIFFISYIYQDTLYPFWWVGSSDTNVLKLAYLQFIPPRSGEYTIKIMKADSNFFNYTFHINNDSLICCGVAGGLGLFGSAWVESVRVFIAP